MTVAAAPTRGMLAAAVAAVVAAAVIPYAGTIHNYFVADDFGVVQLLAGKPAGYFPRWFVTSWMDTIWGFVPDEVRPFPALSYQITALWGAGSPTAHHVGNIVIHAANGGLVLAIARRAAGLDLVASTFAAVVFVLLPVQAESVAWITGRVDSLPALFYLASFLAFVRWRHRPVPITYVASVACCFLALFSKQNTITLPAALILFDLIVLERPIRPTWSWMRPYVPFVILTAGYLALRYALFGQVLRENQSLGDNLRLFGYLAGRHVERTVFGEVGAATPLAWLALLLVAVVLVWQARDSPPAQPARPALGRVAAYFGLVWWWLGVLPVAVAGYESPRHAYLAAAGWAILLACGLTVARRSSPTRLRRAVVATAACLVLAFYAWRLQRAVGHWSSRSAVAGKATSDLARESAAAPDHALLIVGVPVASWEWALPFAAQPPFAPTDATTRISIISPRALYCCRGQWPDTVRDAVRNWRQHPGPVVVLQWNDRSGRLTRISDADYAPLRSIVSSVGDLGEPHLVEQAIRDILTLAPAGR